MSGLTTGTVLYFVLRVADEVPNWSAYSNVRQRTAGDTLYIPPTVTVTDIHGYPNPARTRVTLRFPGGDKEGAPARVRVAIYDLTGHLVSRLLDAVYPAGAQTAEWLCRSDAGSPVARPLQRDPRRAQVAWSRASPWFPDARSRSLTPETASLRNAFVLSRHPSAFVSFS